MTQQGNRYARLHLQFYLLRARYQLDILLQMNSSKNDEGKTLAEGDLLRAVTELANLRDDGSDFVRFFRRWSSLVPEVEAHGIQFERMQRAGIPARFMVLYQRRDALREIWRGNSVVLAELLLPNEPPEELRGREEYLERDDENGHATGWVWSPQISVDWHRGQFTYEPRTSFQKALYLLFRRSRFAKVCANPDCPAPYFIAKKATQHYCSDGCAEVFQRECKRRWWAEHGDAWRRSRGSVKREPIGNRRRK